MTQCIFSGWTSFACLRHVTFVDFVESEMSLGVSSRGGCKFGFTVLLGCCMCFQQQLDVLLVLIALLCFVMCFAAVS